MSTAESFARMDEIEARRGRKVVYPSARPQPDEFLAGSIPDGYQFDANVMYRVAAKNRARTAIRSLEGEAHTYRTLSLRRALYHFVAQIAAAFWLPDAQMVTYLASIISTTLYFLAAVFSLLVTAVLVIDKGAIGWGAFAALCTYGFGTLGHIQLVMHRRLHRAMNGGSAEH